MDAGITTTPEKRGLVKPSTPVFGHFANTVGFFVFHWVFFVPFGWGIYNPFGRGGGGCLKRRGFRSGTNMAGAV